VTVRILFVCHRKIPPRSSDTSRIILPHTGIVRRSASKSVPTTNGVVELNFMPAMELVR